MKKKGRRRGSTLRRLTRRRQPPIAKAVDARQIEAIRKQIVEVAAASRPPRWNADPEDVKRSS
jgi:hypothetical protein